jgi:hypothetical protein
MTDITMAAGFRLANVFSKSFAIFSRRFVPFILLTVIAQIPHYLAVWLIPNASPGGRIDGAALGLAAGGLVIAVLVNLVTGSLASGVVMYGVVQELRGRRFSIGEAAEVVLRRVLGIIGIAICAAIAVMLGMFLLFVPGIILACMLYVSVPACVAERTGVFASMSRSRFLTKGYRWQVFGTILLIAIVALGLVVTVGLALSTIGPAALQISQLAAGAVIGAFGGVVNGVFYYELRVAKEGIDIDKIASVFD